MARGRSTAGVANAGKTACSMGGRLGRGGKQNAFWQRHLRRALIAV